MTEIDQIQQLLQSFAFVVLVGVGVAILLRVISFMRDNLKIHIDPELFCFVEIALNVIDDVVVAVRDEIYLEYSKDGILSEDDMNIIVERSLKIIKGRLNDAQINAITIIHGNLETWLQTQIKKTVENIEGT